MSTALTPTNLSRDDKQRLFSALDVLQDKRAEADQKNSSLLDAKAAEEDLFNRLRELQVARGLPVDEAELRAAVRATREPTGVTYQAPRSGVIRSTAELYINRARWLPATTVVLVLALLGWGGVETTQHVRQQNFESAVAKAQGVQSRVDQKYKQAEQVLAQWPTGKGQAPHKAGFAASLESARNYLAQAWPILNSPTRQNLEEAAPFLVSAENALTQAQTFHALSSQQADLVAKGAQWLALSPDNGWPEAASRMAARKVQLNNALEAGDVSEAREHIQALSTLSTASSARATLREAAALVPSIGQVDAQALKSRGEAALLAGDLSASNQALGDLRTLTDAIATAYTLKIVNENGVDTGFWRRPDNNPSAYNYYVVVDALDASGNPVEIPVVNEENGQKKTTSRFAVRVSEAAFEAVKADKMDNGLVDNAILGTKRAGSVKPDYNMDAGAGIITNW